LTTQLESLSKAIPENKIPMIVFSGDLERIPVAFAIDTGAAAMGMDVVVFLNFGAHLSYGTTRSEMPARTSWERFSAPFCQFDEWGEVV
jgi:hypothetical protein